MVAGFYLMLARRLAVVGAATGVLPASVADAVLSSHHCPARRLCARGLGPAGAKALAPPSKRSKAMACCIAYSAALAATRTTRTPPCVSN